MNYNKAVAMRISELMLKHNINLYKLSIKSNIQYSTLQGIMDEKNKDVRISTIGRIAKAFNLTISEFTDTEYFKNLTDTLE